MVSKHQPRHQRHLLGKLERQGQEKQYNIRKNLRTKVMIRSMENLMEKNNNIVMNNQNKKKLKKH